MCTMSVPSVFSNSPLGHGQLMLNGNGVSIVNALNIKSYSRPIGLQDVYHRDPILKKVDVLPSITPSSRHSSAKSIQKAFSPVTLYEKDVKVHSLRDVENPTCNTKSTPREINIAYSEEGSLVSKELLRFTSAPESHFIEKESGTDNEVSSDDELHEKRHSSSIYRENSSTRRKKRKKKKRRPKSKIKTHEAKHKHDARVENVYNDTSLFKNTAAETMQIQAFCTPIQVSSAPTKTKKPVINYLQHVNMKAPCISKLSKDYATTKIDVAKRTKEYMAVVTSKQDIEIPQYVKENRDVIKKFHEQQTSLYGAKLTSTKPSEISLSTSSENFTCRQPAVKQVHHSLMRKSLGSAPDNNTPPRVIKIYQSDKQSADMEELGKEFPCPPPGTPVADLFKNFEFISSMSDVRSQRSLKLRLESLQKVEKQRKERIKEEKARLEKANQKEKVKELRKQQRREIYALNKKMTELELNNFRDFCQKNGIKCDE